MISFLVLQTIFALSIIVIKKMSLVTTSPFFVVGVRLCLAGVALLVVELLWNKNTFSKLKGNWPLIFNASLLNTYMNNALGLWGIQYLAASKMSIITSGGPFLTALLAYLFFNEKLTQRKFISMLIGLIGFLPIILMCSANQGHAYAYPYLPEGAIVLAVLGSSYGWLLIKELIYTKNFPIFLANGITLFIGGIISFINSYFAAETMPYFSKELCITILFTAFFTHIIGYNLYAKLLDTYSATFIAFTGFLQTSIVALLAWLLLGECIETSVIISAAIIFPSLILFSYEDKGSQKVLR